MIRCFPTHYLHTTYGGFDFYTYTQPLPNKFKPTPPQLGGCNGKLIKVYPLVIGDVSTLSFCDISPTRVIDMMMKFTKRYNLYKNILAQIIL